MISWIQRSFQQHFKWLFLALLVLIIISFVFITNASNGIGQGGARKLPPRPFFGLDLSTPEARRQLATDANLSIYLRFAPGREIPPAQLEQYAFQRHATLHLAEQLGLPAPTQQQIVAHMMTLRAFMNPATGVVEQKRIDEFIGSLENNPRGPTQADVSRVVAEDTLVAAYEKLLAGPGYVLPSDVAETLARRDTTWTLAVASIDGSAFSPRIDTSDTALQAWFEARARNYEIPARASVAALVVPAAKYADAVTLTDSAVRAAYDADPSRYPAPEAKEIKLDPATGADANADAAFLAARPLVEADLRKQHAQKTAIEAATDLAVRLVEQNVKPADLAAFASKHPEATLVEAGPVGPDSIPASLGGASAAYAILGETEKLSADRPYSDPVAIPDGAALLVWRENIPARTPALAEVREKVHADYQAAEKRRLFNEAGAKLHAAATVALAIGKPFADAITSAATAAGLKAEVKTPAPFTLAGQPPTDLDRSALMSLSTLSKGKVGDFLPSGEAKGSIVYVIDQQLPATDASSPAYVEMRDRLAENLAQTDAQALIAQVVAAEMAKSAPAVE